MQAPSPALTRLVNALLTGDRRLRMSLTVTLTSVVSYVLYMAIGALQVASGTMELHWLLIGGVAGFFFNGGVYLLIRAGGTRHLQDPALGPLQLGVGVLFMYFTYATSGPAANATLIILASHVVYAMFAFSVGKLLRGVVLVLAGLGVTMLLCNHYMPQRYPAHLQAIGFAYACLVVPLIATLAVRLARLNERLQSQRTELRTALDRLHELVIRDDLTQTYNRRHMGDLIALQRSHHERHGLPLALALLDLDHFKKINDGLGHAAGDEVLRRFVGIAQRELRGGDLLSRWGGEEFLVLFPATDSGHACAALGRVRDALLAADFKDLSPALRVTFSAGVTTIAADEDVADAIERADHAMYRAKTAGRDRVLTH